MDLGFLLGLWLLGRRVERLATPASLPTRNVVAAGMWGLASVALAFGLTTGVGPPAPAAETASEAVAAAAAGPVEGYYLPRYADWIGKRVVRAADRRLDRRARRPTSTSARGSCCSTARTASTAMP